MRNPLMAAGSHPSPRKDHVGVGKVLGPHGVRGDVRVLPLTDFPERFRHGSYLYLNGREVMVEASRPLRELLIVKFKGIETRNDAEDLRDADITLPEDALHPLPSGEYYRHQILGLTAWTTEGERLGVVKDILPTGSNDVFLIQGERKEYVIPYIQDIVREIDLDSQRMLIQVVPGLLD